MDFFGAYDIFHSTHNAMTRSGLLSSCSFTLFFLNIQFCSHSPVSKIPLDGDWLYRIPFYAYCHVRIGHNTFVSLLRHGLEDR